MDWTIRKCRKLVAKTRHCNIVVIVAMSEAVKESARKRLFKDKPSRHVKAGMDKRRPINKEESERERKFSTFLKQNKWIKAFDSKLFSFRRMSFIFLDILEIQLKLIASKIATKILSAKF